MPELRKRRSEQDECGTQNLRIYRQSVLESGADARNQGKSNSCILTLETVSWMESNTGFEIAMLLFAELEGKRNEPAASDEAAGNFLVRFSGLRVVDFTY